MLVRLGFEPMTSRSADRHPPKWANQAACFRCITFKLNCGMVNIKNCITGKYWSTWPMNKEWETNTLRLGSLNFVWPKFDQLFYVYWLPWFWSESKIYLLCPFLSFWGSWDSTKISTSPERITGREAYTTPDPDWVWHLWWFWANLWAETTRNFFKNVCWS